MSLENKVKKLQEEIEKIHLRNRRVESDKAWELSKTRTGFIAISTYILMVIFMMLISDKHPYFNALISTIAYVLSTSTYGVLKAWWLRRNKTQL